ncbi:MAG TPA: tetratricopeptide repeat protein [Longimicrobium sp.]|nr:tetratricopeptide repeat protein [Longimicrobium sp.]
MSRSEATVEALLGLLPDFEDLEVLRLLVVGAGVPDPQREWESWLNYATFDKRIVTQESVLRALADAEEAQRQYVSTLHQGLLPVFQSFFEGDHDGAARHLIALGEALEDSGRVQGARKFYQAALNLTLPFPDKTTQIVALRRIARVTLTLGELQEAYPYYERSSELARDAGDARGEVIARTGMGNLRMWQGRWSEAEAHYREALSLADGDGAAALDLTTERGHLYNNLVNLTTRQQRLDESERWFEKAIRLWEGASSPVDLAVCHFNYAHLREAQERWEEARRGYETALALPIPPRLRSLIATDFSEWCLQNDLLTQAEEWGRVAEEQAIAARSPYTLGHMYRGRGKVALARGAADGFTFFEKALEIAREKGYVFLEAETLVDYAALRAQNGGADEAKDFLKHACDIFGGLGALGELERARKALAALAEEEPRDDEEPPLAAAD